MAAPKVKKKIVHLPSQGGFLLTPLTEPLLPSSQTGFHYCKSRGVHLGSQSGAVTDAESESPRNSF